MIKLSFIRMKILCLALLIALLTGCEGSDAATITVGYTLPIIPITFSIDSTGHIKVSVGAQLVTALGEFSVSVGAPITSFSVPDDALLVTIRHKEDGNLVDSCYRINTGEKGTIDVKGNISEVKVGWTGKNNSIFIDASNGNITSIVIQGSTQNTTSVLKSNPNKTPSVTSQVSINPTATAQSGVNTVATAQVGANATATAQSSVDIAATAQAQAQAQATVQANVDATATTQAGINMAATAQASANATATAQSSSTLAVLGGLSNLSGYCQSNGDSTAALDGNTAYNWSCVTSSGQHAGMSMTGACRWQYNDPNAEDRLVNYFDPYSWQCFTNAQRLGGLSNLSGYCQSIGDSTASLDGNTAYNWNCVTTGGQHVGMSMTDACQWQYHNSHALDRLVNYSDPYSWECWG